MPGGVCCLLGACCPPHEQKIAIHDALVAKGMSSEHAMQAAEIMAPLIADAHKKTVSEIAKAKRKK